ncbi:MAG: cation-transporting P-type ATPase [Parachlamydiales bacterium]|nr:cation-transporting P-type ATPase [Parachlamydiales bacterium]
MEHEKSHHSIKIDEIVKLFNTSFDGLTQNEANKRLDIYGKNSLKEKEDSKIAIFFRQFNNILVYVLVIASLISLFTHKYIDFSAIIFLIIVNGVIGFIQEIKALSSIKALKKMTESKTHVLRDKKTVYIPSEKIVPGDVAIFSEGSVVTADVRLSDSSSLMVDESSITGESLPVIKDHLADVLEEALPYELKNTLLAGTTIVKGRAKGIVTKTADNTYFASIAEEKEKSPTTPLTKAIENFSKRYMSLLLVLFCIIGIIGFLQGRSWVDLAYILIAELVSALPAGLPIVVTTVLVVGAIALSRKKTLVRHLPSVQTLGSATVIASDKTGTITEGKLIVQEWFSDDIEKLKLISALCNDAESYSGDPIDVALNNWIKNAEDIRKRHKRVKSYPFDVNQRYMATVNELNSEKYFFIKGAFESLKEMAINDKENIKQFEEKVFQLSQKGLRILAFGMKKFDNNEKLSCEIIGVIGFLDPAKPHVRQAVIEAQKAGIKILMLTGDFPATAKAIATDVNIFKENDDILTGKEIDQMDDTTLYNELKKTSVLARILPDHKSRIVKVLQQNKQIVAVSGDGVNDVPALRAADLGIAMGSGTEAAKSVSKMIITDSNLKVIVDAIRNGRIISQNIRKVIYYLISTGIQEITLISLAIFMKLPLPLTPLQILWINIVTDGVLDKTFPFAKEERNLMHDKPKKSTRQFFDLKQIINIISFGLISGLFIFELFKHLLRNFNYEISLTITFTCVVFMQWANGIQAQKEYEPFFKNIKNSLKINPYIYFAVVLGILLQIFAVYVATDIFSSIRIPINLWLYPIIMFLVAFFIVEIRKWIFLLFRRKK